MYLFLYFSSVFTEMYNASEAAFFLLEAIFTTENQSMWLRAYVDVGNETC